MEADMGKLSARESTQRSRALSNDKGRMTTAVLKWKDHTCLHQSILGALAGLRCDVYS